MKKVVGWSAKVLEEGTSSREFEDKEEMVQRRSVSHEEVDNQWTDLSGK